MHLDKTVIGQDDVKIYDRLERLDRGQAGSVRTRQIAILTKKLTWLLIKESFDEKLPSHGLFK